MDRMDRIRFSISGAVTADHCTADACNRTVASSIHTVAACIRAVVVSNRTAIRSNRAANCDHRASAIIIGAFLHVLQVDK